MASRRSRDSIQLFTGGTIRTVDSPELVDAVLVVGDRIETTGSRAECEAAAATTPEIVDLDGATMLPGFVDAHTHPLMLGQCASWADLTGASSIDEVVKVLREHDLAQADRSGPIRGFGYDHHVLGTDDEHPTSLDLDRVSDARPVEMMHTSGHGYVVNSVSMAEAGIDASTVTPDGGRRDRVSDARPVEMMHTSGHGYVVNSVSMAEAGIDASTVTPDGGRLDRFADGSPTGVVFDAACDLLTGPDGVKITNHGPNLHLPEPPIVLDEMLDLGQRMLNEAGITSVGDCQVTEREMTNWLRARDDGRLTLRVSMMILSSHLPLLEGLGIGAWLGDDELAIAGLKLYCDGALSAGMAHVPCGCSVNHRPDTLYHDAAEYTDLVVRAHELGLQTGTHAQGPIPIGMVIDAVTEAQRRTPRSDVRHRIEHCGFPTDDQIASIKELGLLPIPQPAATYLYGEGARRDYGDIAERMYPSGLFDKAGIPVVLSSDVPVSMPDVFLAMWAAVTRRTARGSLIGPDCTIDRVTALRGYTIEGAWAMHREHDIGSIRPGKFADFVIVSDDPITCELDAMLDIEVLQTWRGGQRLP